MITIKGNSHKTITAQVNEVDPQGAYVVFHLPKADINTMNKVSTNAKVWMLTNKHLIKVKGSVKANIEGKEVLFLDISSYNKDAHYNMEMFTKCNPEESIDAITVKGKAATAYKLLPAFKQAIQENLQDTVYEEEFLKSKPEEEEQKQIKQLEPKEISTKDVPKVIKEIQEEVKETIISSHHSSNENLIKEIRRSIEPINGVIWLSAQESFELLKSNEIRNDVTYFVEFDPALREELRLKFPENMFYGYKK